MISRMHWQSPQLFAVMTVLLIGALAAILLFYRPQVRSLSGSWSALLLALRGAAMGALALSVLRPSLLLPATRADRDVVAILVDHSKSMAVVDQSFSKPELIRIAAATNALPSGVRPSALVNLRQKVNDLLSQTNDIALARSELEYARLAGRGIESAEARMGAVQRGLLSAVQSAAISAPPILHDQVSRITPENAGNEIPATLAQIDKIQGEADQQLYNTNEQVRSICDELAGLSRAARVQRALDGEDGLISRLSEDRQVRMFEFARAISPVLAETLTSEANGTRTDLASALREVRRAVPAQGVAAVVVFSDGRQTTPDTSTLSAPINDIPVIVVPTAAPVNRDLAIAQVSLPSAAFIGETVMAGIDLIAIGMDGVDAEILVENHGRRQSQKIKIANDGGHAEVPIVIAGPGPQEINISVAPIPGEVTFQNNSLRRVVKGIANKMKLALISGVATRDFQQLRSAASSAAGFTVIDRLVDSTTPLDIPAEQLAAQDVIVLYDVPASALSQRQWDAIARSLNEQGCGVILIASDPSLLAVYAARPATASLLPWQANEPPPAWRVWPGEVPQMRIVPGVADLPDQLRLSGDPEVSRQRWSQLPPIFRVIAMPKLKPGVRSLLVDRDSRMPVMTEMRIGAGRGILLGINEVWRWQGVNGDQADRIWLQILQHAAQEPYGATDGVLSLDVNQSQGTNGEQVRARARINATQLATDGPLSLQLVRDGDLIKEQELNVSGESIDRFEETFSDLAAGQYDVRLVCGDRSISLPVRITESDEAEMRDVSPDPATLQSLAGARGEVLAFDQIKSLPQRIAKLRRSEPKYTEFTLWDSPYLFLFVLGCLGLEWAMRKRIGLT